MECRSVLPLVVSLLAVVHAGPLSYFENSDTQCATTCPDTHKFGLEAGYTYHYRYSTDMMTNMAGASDETSALHLQANVQLQAVSSCEMALSMTDVSLSDSDPTNVDRRRPVQQSAEFRRALERQALRFGWIDGRVESVCGNTEEPTWVLNIKRAVISSLQNSMTRLDADVTTRETDISGDCEVEYKVQGTSWGTTTVKKNKDLLTCRGRQSAHTIFQTTHYNVPSKLQSLPLVKSSQECEQQINKAGIIARSTCTEKHVFRPFSRHNSGATTEVSATLAFERKTRGTTITAGTIEGRQSLMFDHSHSRLDIERNYNEAEQTIRQMCQQSEVRPDTPGLFNNLVLQMRSLDSHSLLSLHQLTAGNSLCRISDKLFHDALPTVSTEASVSVMAQLLLNEERDSVQDAGKWLGSLSFVPSATRNMLSAVKPLLEHATLSRKAALPVSALVNTYCREHAQCGSDNEVREIVAIFEKNLANNCHSADHDLVLMSLKAIGNTGHAEHVVPTLNRCLLNEQLPAELRVAAISAFRRMGCTADHTDLENMFKKKEADSELRINAYLALMQCPTEFLISSIRRTLESEEVNQVGSFVWTHLTNLKESSSPFKQQARLILEDAKLQKQFDLDKRKFSRNIEKSVFSEILNVGGTVESNLIWSTQSYIPRSASLNLTADIFGATVNLVEFGGRVQGLDGVLERLFVDPKEDTNEINLERLDNLDNQFAHRREETPQGSYFVRVFGNEIRYDDFHGFDLDSLKEKFNYLQWLIELAKKHEFEYTKSDKFMDSTLCLPTVAGMPLKLTLQGTAVFEVKVNGKLDIRNLATAPRSVDIDGSIKPSAAIQINSQMGIDAWFAMTGLKMTNTFHTSTYADGKIKLQNGKIFNMNINMPKERMEIFDYSSKFYIIHREEEREQSMITQDRTELTKCTGAKLETITGLQLCASISYPDLYSPEGAPWFPFNGPMSAAIYLDKKDTYDEIKFEAVLMQEKTRSRGKVDLTDKLRVALNTPGSRIDREMSFDFTLNHAEKNLNVNMRSPWSQAQLTGSITNEPQLKRLSVNLMVNQKQEYGAVAQIQINKGRIEPLFEMTVPSMQPIRLGGSIISKNNRRMDVDLSLENALSQPVTLKATFVNKKFEKMTADVDVTSQWVNFDVNSYVDRSKGSLDGSIKVNYKMAGGKKYRFMIDQSYRRAQSGASSEINYSGSYASTRWPGYNTDIIMKWTKDASSQSFSFNGGLSRNKAKRLMIEQQASLNMGSTKTANVAATIKMPFYNVDMALTSDNTLRSTELSTNTKLQYATNKEIKVEVALMKEAARLMKMSADAKLQWPGHDMSYSHSIEETSPKNFAHSLNVKLNQETAFDLESTYKMRPRHELSTTIKMPSMQPISIEAHLKPELHNFQLRSAAIVHSKPYSIELNWMHRNNRAGINTKVDMDVVIADRQVTSEAQLIKQGTSYTTSFDTKWDAKRDQNKKFALTAEVQAVAAPTVQLKATWWPRQFVEINGNFKNEKANYWSSHGDLEAHIDAKSSFRSYDDLSFNMKIESQGTEHKAHYDASWNSRSKIILDSSFKMLRGLSSFEFTTALSTPFQELSTAGITINHDFQSTQIKSEAKVEWNDKQINLDVNGRANLARHRISGTVSFSSPFEGMEQLSLTGRHTDDGSNYQSGLEMSWARNQRAAMAFTMTHSRNGWFVDNNGQLTITTPFYPFTSNKLTWNHKNTRTQFHPHIELEIGSEKSVFDLSATSKVSYRKYKAELKSVLNTPYFSNLRMNIKHEHDKKQYASAASSMSFQWSPDKTITIEYDLSSPSSLSFTNNMKFTSPFRGFEVVTVNGHYNLEGPFTYSEELSWGSNKKISLNAEAELSGSDISGKATFTSPYTEDYIINLDHKLEVNMWQTSASLQYAPSKKIQFEMQAGGTTVKKLNIDFQSPCPVAEHFSFDLEHSGELKNFRNKIEIKHNLLDEPIIMNINSDISTFPDVKATFDIRTPINKMPFFGITFNNEHRQNKISTDLSIRNPLCPLDFNQELNLFNWFNFDTQSTFEYCSDKIELTTRLSAESKISGLIELKTPFKNFEDISLTINHDGQLNDFKCNAELSYSPYPKTSAVVEFKKSGRTISGNVRLTGIEEMSVQFQHRGHKKNFRNSATVQFRDRRYSVNSEFSLRGNNMKLEGGFTSPISGFESVTLNIQHDGTIRAFTNEASFEYSGKRFSSNAKFTLDQNIEGKLEVHTPLKKMRTFIVQFNHAGKMPNFQNSMSMQINRNTYSGNTMFSLEGNKLEAQAFLKLPEEYSIVLNHQGPLTDFNNRLNIGFDGQRIAAESSFALSGQNLDASAQLSTPFEPMRLTSFRVSHAGYWTNFNCEAELRLNEQMVTERITFVKQAESLSGTLQMKTPWQKLNSLSVSFDHKGNMKQFENSGSVDINEEIYTCSSRFSMSGNTLTGNLQVHIPSKDYSLEISHKGHRSNWRNSAAMKLNGQSLNANTAFKWNRRGLTGSAGFTSPYKLLNRLEASMSHSGQLTDFENSATLELNSNRYSGSSQFKVSGNEVSGRATIRLPTEYEISFSHNGALKQFSNSANLKLDGVNYDAQSEFSLDGNKLLGAASLRIPEEYGIEIKHEGEVNNFKNSGKLQLAQKQYTANSSFRRNSRSINGEAKINIPTEYGIQFKHQGQLNDFNNDATLTLNSQRYTANSLFSKQGSSVNGAASINIPDTYSVTFNHQGGLTAFTNNAEVNVAGRRFSGETEFEHNSRKTNGKVHLNIPEEYSINFEHRGDRSAFSNNGNVNIAGRKYFAESEFSNSPNNFNGMIKLNVPDEYSLSFDHSGRRSQFTNSGVINVAGRRYSAESELNHETGKLNGKVKLNIPEEYSLSIDHNGDKSAFSNSGTINVAGRRFTGNSEFNKNGNEITASANIRIPNAYGFQFSHNGGLKSFSNNGEVTVDGKVYSGESRFTLNSKGLEANAAVRVPEQYSISLKHTGGLNDFSNEGSIRTPSRNIEGNSKFAYSSKKINGDFQVKLPQEYGITFNHEGPVKSFSNDVAIKTPRKTYTGSSELKMEDDGLSATIRVNLSKEYSINFNIDGMTAKQFNTKATVIMGNKKYSGRSEFTRKGKKCEGRVILRLPELYSLKFNHQGHLKAFANSFDVKAFGQKYTAGSQFRINGNTIRGTANIRMPQEYSITFSHSGIATDFNNNVETILNGKTYSGISTFKKEGHNIDMTAQLTTPFNKAKNIEIKYNQNGDITNFKQDAFFAVDDIRYSTKSELVWNNYDLTGHMELATPHDILKDIQIDIEHEGKMKNFKNSANLKFNEHRFSTNGELKLFGKKKQGSLTINIPEQYGISFIHKGQNLKDWTNKVTLDYANKKMSINSGFTNNKRGLEALLSMQTPYQGAEKIGFNFNFKPTEKGFKVITEVNTPCKKYNRFASELEFEGNWRRYTLDGKIETPIAAVPVLTFKSTQLSQLSNFEWNAEGAIGSEKISVDFAHRKFGKNLETSLSVHTPFTNYEKTGFALIYSGEKGAINTNVQIDMPFEHYKSASFNFNHKGSLKDFQTTARIETPIKSYSVINLEANHKGDSQEFASFASIDCEGRRFTGQAAFKRSSGWLDGSHTATLKINTPIRPLTSLDIDVQHHMIADGTNGKISLEMNGKKLIDGDYTLSNSVKKSININVRQPYQMSESFSIEKTSNGFELINDVNWNTLSRNSNAHAQVSWGTENNKMYSNGEFETASLPNSRIAYNIEGSANRRRHQSVYDGKIKVDSHFTNLEATLNHIHAPGRRYVTAITAGKNRAMSIRNQLTVNQGIKDTLTITHPSLHSDIIINTEGNVGGDSLFEGKASFEYNNQKVESTAKVMDRSDRRSGDSRYATEWRLTHPASFLDFQITSELQNSKQAMSGNMQFNYMTTADRQMKSMSLRSEINKLRDELNMQIKTPVNDMSVTGRIVPQKQGAQQIIVTGNMDEHQVRAELELNPHKPAADLKLYQNEKMLHVYGKYVDRSTVRLEAYRQVDGARVQDAQLALHLNNSRLLHVRAYMRPELVRDVQRLLPSRSPDARVLWAWTDSVCEDVRAKMTSLYSAFRPIVDLLTSYVRAVTDSITNYLTLSESTTLHWSRIRTILHGHKNRVHSRVIMASNKVSDLARNTLFYAASSRDFVHGHVSRLMAPHMQTLRDTEYYHLFEAWLGANSERLNSAAAGIWNSLGQYPQLKQIVQSYAEGVTQKLERLRRSEAVQMLDEISRLSFDAVRDKLIEVVEEYTQLNKTRFTVWNPNQGEFQFEVHFPVPLKDLKSLPHTKYVSQMKQLQSVVSMFWPTSDYSMWDTFYSYKPTSDISNWVPPFKARATISGRQHYVTFDNRHFEFAGECSYLLARNFMDRSWSVIVNYDKVRGQVVKKSITVLSGGKNIEIFSNNKINIDGKQTELPVTAASTLVYREADTVVVDNGRGMSVTCYLTYDRCTIELSGWHYNKTAGLLGTLDNEPSNDFTTSQRGRATTPEQLADSWTVGPKCRVANHAIHVPETQADRRSLQLCAKYFEQQSSPLRKCFKQVEHKALMDMCLDDMPLRSNRLASESDVCGSVAFYVRECSKRGVYVPTPSHCMTCQLPNGKTFSNKTTLRGAEVPQSADIVLVVSHRSCNADLVNKLDNIVNQIDSSFKESGIKRVRYSLVGYAGDGKLRAPHMHTMESQISQSKFKFPKAIQNFKLSAADIEDPLEAIEYAARLPFRAGVTKSIILLPCASCDQQAVNYGDVYRLLQLRDVRLHVFSQQHFQLKAKGKSTSFIFGADSRSVYTNKDVGSKDITGDDGLRTQLIMPKDLCVALSAESNGAVFNSLKLVEGRALAQKKFLDVLSRVVAKKASPTDCQLCDCLSDKYGSQTAVCRSCTPQQSPFWQQKKVEPKQSDVMQKKKQENLKQKSAPKKKLRELKRRRKYKKRN